MRIIPQLASALCLLFLASCSQTKPSSQFDGSEDTQVAEGDGKQDQESPSSHIARSRSHHADPIKFNEENILGTQST